MEKIIEISGLKKYFSLKKGLLKKRIILIKALDDIGLDIHEGETMGLVGESGCGKTTLGRTILKLIEPTSGSIFFDGSDTSKASGLKELRKKMSIVFQDPFSSLNPRSTIRTALARPLIINGVKKEMIDSMIKEVIHKVNLGEELLFRYPHQLSGGQQQRVSIARAIILKPKLLILDEPTSSLDISVQAQILNLLLDLQEEYRLTYLFISHDLNVVNYISDRIGVMYLGKLIELAPVDEINTNPRHPYTLGLFSSSPILSPKYRKRKKLILAGEPGSTINPPTGCRFHPRCPHAEDICKTELPELRKIKEHHWVACHRAEKINDVKEYLPLNLRN